MSTTALILTFTLVALFSFLKTEDTSKSLANLWVVSLLSILFLFTKDLDLLGSTMFAIYSSVFLFLTLLSIVQWSHGGGAIKPKVYSGASFVLFVLLLLCSSVDTRGGVSIQQHYTNLVWQDVYSLTSDIVYSVAILFHFIFYKLFIGETLLFNVYILFGLIVAVVIVSVLQVNNNSRNPVFYKNKVGLAQPKVKSITAFRRQVRRKNNSIIRNKLN